MIKFNKDNKDKLTYRDILTPITGIKTAKEAEKYINDYVKWVKELRKKNINIVYEKTAESVCESNIISFVDSINIVNPNNKISHEIRNAFLRNKK